MGFDTRIHHGVDRSKRNGEMREEVGWGLFVANTAVRSPQLSYPLIMDHYRWVRLLGVRGGWYNEGAW